MCREKLERLYKERGLDNYRLKTEEDLFYIHGIKVEQIEGYERLNESEKRTFREFIINFYNAHKLEDRKITPVKVYIALQKNYVIDTEEIKSLPVRRVLLNAKTNEVEELWQYKRFIDHEAKLNTIEKYMRFEYILDGTNSWLHVNKGDSWY